MCLIVSVVYGRYIDDLMKLKAQAHTEGNEFITWNDIQSCVDRVNVVVHEEHESKCFHFIPTRVTWILRNAKTRFTFTGMGVALLTRR